MGNVCKENPMITSRLLLTISGPIHPSLKMAMKMAGGKWDDLFSFREKTAYSFPVENSGLVSSLMADYRGRYQVKEVKLPLSHVNGKEPYMSLKYAMLLQKLVKQEEILIQDIARWLRVANEEEAEGLTTIACMYKYLSPPDLKKCKSDAQYFIEENLHKRVLECHKLRLELNQISHELSIVEKAPRVSEG